jgi:hypothetical protein
MLGSQPPTSNGQQRSNTSENVSNANKHCSSSSAPAPLDLRQAGRAKRCENGAPASGGQSAASHAKVKTGVSSHDERSASATEAAGV